MLADHIGIPQLRDMASRSERLGCHFDVQKMPRLKCILSTEKRDSVQQIEVQLVFHNGSQGFPEILGAVSGSLELRCQRCLGALEWPVNMKFQLVVVEADADVESVADPFDTIVAGEHGVNLVEIVEDELLGSLPLSPMHENVDSCTDAAYLKQAILNQALENESNQIEGGDVAGWDDPDQEEVSRPFAGLAAMLKSNADPEEDKS